MKQTSVISLAVLITLGLVTPGSRATAQMTLYPVANPNWVKGQVKNFKETGASASADFPVNFAGMPIEANMSEAQQDAFHAAQGREARTKAEWDRQQAFAEKNGGLRAGEGSDGSLADLARDQIKDKIKDHTKEALKETYIGDKVTMLPVVPPQMKAFVAASKPSVTGNATTSYANAQANYEAAQAQRIHLQSQALLRNTPPLIIKVPTSQPVFGGQVNRPGRIQQAPVTVYRPPAQIDSCGGRNLSGRGNVTC